MQSGSVSLSGTTAQSWSHGRAIFTDLAIASTSDGTAFTLQASASGLASGTTSSLTCDVVASQLVFAQDASHAGVPHGDVLSGGDLAPHTGASHNADIAATRIVFVTLPADPAAPNGDVVSGIAFATQPILEAQNASGQRDLNFAGTATLALAAGGATLSGTTAVAFSAGRADFAQSGLKATAATDGDTFALQAATSGLAEITSATLTADVVATRIALATPPADLGATNGDVVSGQIFSLQPILEARDDSGQRDLHLSGTAVGLSVASATAELSGNNSQNWSSGQAVFDGLAATCEDGSAFELQASGTDCRMCRPA